MSGEQGDALDPPDWPAWFDGEFAPARDVRIPARSAWALHGVSVFETLAVVGGRVGFEQAHAKRLAKAAQTVFGRDPGAAWSESLAAARETARRLSDFDLALRVTLAEAEGGGWHRLVQARPLRRVTARSSAALEDQAAQGSATEAAIAADDSGANEFRKGVTLRVPPGELSKLTDFGPTGFKHGARLGHRLAQRAARAAGAFDALLLGSGGDLLCGTIGNLVARTDAGWITPPVADGALPGIARGALLEAGDLDRLGALKERPLTPRALGELRGLWLVGSVLGVAPVTGLVGLSYPGKPQVLDVPGSLGAAWRALSQAFESAERTAPTCGP